MQPSTRRSSSPPHQAPTPPGLRVFAEPAATARSPRYVVSLVRALRPHQWVKNTLLLVPLALAHQLADVAKLWAVAEAFVAFCMCASAVYLINDVLDRDDDRRHPTKCNRPVAAGLISVPAALSIAMLLLAAAFGLSLAWLPPALTAMLGGYLLLTTGYSLYWKRTLFLDVLFLAGLYAYRIFTGGVAAGVEVSPWLLGFSMFLFISLALVKRYVELRDAQQSGTPPNRRRGYRIEDVELIRILGPASGYLSVLVFWMYVSSNAVEALYTTPGLLWLIAPLLLYWITRIWLLANRGQIDADPVTAALKDAPSYAVGAACASILLMASWSW